MKLRGITLENFGPFYGHNALDLSVVEDAPVVLIHGENMRGKTTLLNAIRWGLYGSSQGMGFRAKETLRYLNYDSLQDGDYHMSVLIEFEHDSHAYGLQRHVQASIKPQYDSDLEQKVELKRDGHFQPAGRIDEIIRGILHPRISRFFLFDGEMMDQFEVLLSTPGRDTELIKGSIEQILGLPALQNGMADLHALQRLAESKQLKAVQQKRKNEGLVARAQQAQNGIDAIEKDIASLKSLLSDLTEQRAALAERRESFAEIRGDIREIEKLEGDRTVYAQEQAKYREEGQAIIGAAVWEAASVRASQMLSEAESQMEASLVGLEIQNSLKVKIEQTKDSIESKSCGLCGSPLNEEMRARLSIDLASMLAKLSTAERFGDSAAKSQARIRKLRRYASAPTLNHFAELERNALKAKLDVHRIDRQIADVKVRIRGYDRSEITRVESEYDSVVARIAKLNDDIAARERECRDQQATLARLQLEIARLPDADPSIAAEVAVCSALRETFRKAIDEFQDRLREDVEEQATEIFRVLTTEKQYAGLRINEQFGLSIVDDENRVVRDRSAGAEQIVALSLIGALNRCATREGPIVMDTPFGRLDVGHRANVLGFVPKMGPQVVLLVQSGEFSRSADLKYLEGKVSQEYKILRHGKATRSRFEPVE